MLGAIFWGETFFGGMPVAISPTHLKIASISTAPLLGDVSVSVDTAISGTPGLNE